MPTNILRKKSVRASGSPLGATATPRVAVLVVGDRSIRMQLEATQTADRIWAALPLHATVDTWGDSIHFAIPVKSGRDRTARLNVRPGDICFWSEDDCVIVGWGPTPISRPDEIRLMAPCNVWARALDDVSALRVATPGEKVSLKLAT